MFDSLQVHGLWPTGLLCPWDSPVKNIGVGCHALLQCIFCTQGLNPGLPHCRQIFYSLSYPGSPSSFLNFLVLCLIFSFLLTVPQSPISEEQKLDSPIFSSLLSANQLVSRSADSDTISLFTVLRVWALVSFSLSHQSVNSRGYN